MTPKEKPMDIEKLKPTFDRILVKKVKEEKTAGGIIIPITIEDDNTVRIVILALGPTVNSGESVAEIENQFEVGDFCLMNKYAGIEIGKETGVYLIKANDVLAIID